MISTPTITDRARDCHRQRASGRIVVGDFAIRLTPRRSHSLMMVEVTTHLRPERVAVQSTCQSSLMKGIKSNLMIPLIVAARRSANSVC